MKFKTFIGIGILLFILELFSPMLHAANFRCGFLRRKVEATLSIPRPPDILIFGRNIQVVVAETPRTFNRADKNRIRMEVEQALTPDFIGVSNNPEAIFKVYVVDYDSNINRSKKTERRRIVVGKECTTDKNGKERCADKYEDRNVPVEYWEANARMNWRIEVEDSSGTLIDIGFSAGDSYESKKEVSVNGVSQLGRTSLPNEREIKSQMITNTANKFTRRYRKTYDSVTVDLACDDELSVGNKLVQDSNNVVRKDWEGALKLWESAKMKKAETEGDRLYNMAVAYEALAFRAFDESGVPEDADPYFYKALALYQQSMALDPGEKYIQRAADRLPISQNSLRRAKEQKEILDQEERFALELALAEEEYRQLEEEYRQLIEEERRLAMARSEKEDTPEEKNFRTYFRARFVNTVDMDDEEEEKIVISGQEMFNIDENQTLRVIDQEVLRNRNIRKYREEFDFFVKKGTITKDDRDALNAIATSLSMTADDIKTAESAYAFKDESTPVKR